MSNEITVFEPMIPVTNQDLNAAAERRKILREFVKSQMVEGVDYGIIPGVKTQSLFKPGAEKLALLFGLGVRISSKDKEIDMHQNFSMFSYVMEAYHLRTGTVIAQCEGSTNSHEKKWKTRYNNGAREETPIGDIMNTLMKMAQKRGYVGVIIQATGASDFYTQDIDDVEDANQLGIKSAPKKASVSIPGVKSAMSTTENDKPICCGKPMMVSKFHDNTLYCTSCKSTKAIKEEAPA
jgi:hypothetical protein